MVSPFFEASRLKQGESKSVIFARILIEPLPSTLFSNILSSLRPAPPAKIS